MDLLRTLAKARHSIDAPKTKHGHTKMCSRASRYCGGWGTGNGGDSKPPYIGRMLMNRSIYEQFSYEVASLTTLR